MILFALSSGKYWNFLDFSPRDPVRQPFSFQRDKNLKLSRAIRKRFRKPFAGETEGAPAPVFRPGETPGSLPVALPRAAAPIIKARTAEGGGSTKTQD